MTIKPKTKNQNNMKTAILTISIGQEKAMFNPSSEVREHYAIKFKYRSLTALNKRVAKYTTYVASMPALTGVMVFNLAK